MTNPDRVATILNMMPLGRIQKSMFLIQMNRHKPTTPKRRNLIKNALREIQAAAKDLAVPPNEEI